MRLKITIGFAALAVGASLVAVPAFAQQNAPIPGYSSDGAAIAMPQGQQKSGVKPLYNSARQHTQKHSTKNLGRLQNDREIDSK
jgi:hypothetical protein